MIALTLVSTKRVLTMTTTAKRLLLFAHMQWRPGKSIVLPVRWSAEKLGLKPGSVSIALNELIAAGLLVRTRCHARPGTPGGSHAAEYQLVHRRKSKYEPNQILDRTGVFAVLDHGDEVRPGWVQVLDTDLLQILRDVPKAPFELRCFATTSETDLARLPARPL